MNQEIDVKKLKKHRSRIYRLSAGDITFNIFNYLFFALFALTCIFPLYYLLINTISDNELARIGAIKFYPVGIHLDNYKALMSVHNLGNSVLISVARTVIGTSLMVVASGFVGYIVTKQEMWGRRFWYRFLIITMYFNAGLIPWYLNMSMLGLTNNFLAYIIPSIVAPYNIILVKTYIESIPAELEESAKMDGAGYMKIFAKLIWPLSKPILATIAIFGAVGQWNSFTDSMILMSGNAKLYALQYQLYVYLTQMNNLQALVGGGGAIPIDLQEMALNARTLKYTVAMITILPIICVYPFMQRYFVKGIMMGAVKG